MPVQSTARKIILVQPKCKIILILFNCSNIALEILNFSLGKRSKVVLPWLGLRAITFCEAVKKGLILKMGTI